MGQENILSLSSSHHCHGRLEHRLEQSSLLLCAGSTVQPRLNTGEVRPSSGHTELEIQAEKLRDNGYIEQLCNFPNSSQINVNGAFGLFWKPKIGEVDNVTSKFLKGSKCTSHTEAKGTI